jgi:hypothetical protein
MEQIRFVFDIDANYLEYFRGSEDWSREVREKFLEEFRADITERLDEVCSDALQRLIDDADVEDLEAQVEAEEEGK